MMRFNRLAILIATAAMAASSAAGADIIFLGSARAIAMGGAGVAVVDRSEQSSPINPAALALTNRRSRYIFPNIGFSFHGIPIEAAYDHLIRNPSSNGATELARDFGGQRSDFGASLGLGWRFGHLDARAWGLGTVRIEPNAALQTWSKNANGDVTQLTGAERADLFGAGIYSIPTIGLAERISPPGSPIRVEAGARFKLQRAVYSHYIVSSANIAANTAATPAPELGSGTTITKDRLGVDFGILAHPRSHSGFSGALVVTNLIEPDFVFAGTDALGAATKIDLQPRSVTVGGAYEAGRMLVAFDAVDVTRAYSNVQGRFGVEYASRGVALRGGYSTATGFTAGFGWGFLQIAFGARAPLSITETLRF
jgi:hypothetical protein